MFGIVQRAGVGKFLHLRSFPVPAGKCGIGAVASVAGVVVENNVSAVVNLVVVIGGVEHVCEDL